jgi:two-component system, OmpR family, KDP operon response regulator KdpE
MARILVIDREPQIRTFLAVSLGASGHKVVEAENAVDGLNLGRGRKYDLVILDIDLPDMNGQDLVSAIRKGSSVPIMVLSARSEEAQKVEALDRGANDYVVKPFAIGELLARIRAALRHKADRTKPEFVVAGDVRIDLTRRTVTRGNQAIHLTKREFELLKVLASSPDHVLPHLRLAKLAWGAPSADDTARLRVYINQLRQKLEATPSAPQIIITEAGIGYRLRTNAYGP